MKLEGGDKAPEKPDMGYGKEKDFSRKKKKFFLNLGLRVREALKLHKDPGLLWQQNEKGEREWDNVSKHCLVEVARVRVFAEKLGLPAKTQLDLELGAALHDFNKRNEILAMKAAIVSGESGAEASDLNDKEGEGQLREAGFGEDVIELVNSIGGKHPELFEMERILAQEKLTDHDIARLVMHYTDGYTCGSDWAEPVMRGKNGEIINEVDRRMQKNLENPNYHKQDVESIAGFTGHSLLEGRGCMENESVICHMIEERLVTLIAEKTSEKINPLELPEIIDREIKNKIEFS